MKFMNSEKAEAEVVGYIIILGLTITGIAMITLIGVPFIMKLQDMSTVRNAEQAYTALDSRVSQVALGTTPKQIVNVELGDGYLSVSPNSSFSSSDESYILFEFKNVTGTERINIPMGKIVYRKGDREVAYEGGGVWGKYPSGSVMLSPPEFNYNGVTITMPVINITGNFSEGGKGTASLEFEKKGNVTLLYPTANPNPISTNISEVKITVRSEYYDAWADYFRTQTLVSVNSSPSEKKVTVTLDPPPIINNFSYGALASKRIVLQNTASIDSYNSSIGPYDTSKSESGSIRANDEIYLSNTATVKGNAETSGSITEGSCNGGKCKILKEAYYTSIGTKIEVNGSTCPNSFCFPIPVRRANPPDTNGLVEGKISSYSATNNNLDASSGGCLNGAGYALDGIGWTDNKCTISTGNYYLTTFDLPNNRELTFDTNSGNINIAVPANIGIKASNVIVNGSGKVKIYLRGGMTVESNSVVNYNTNQTSSRFQVISNRNLPISFSQGNTIFVGIVFAPYATISVSQGAQIFGAMVGDTFSVTNSQYIHFDQDLKSLQTDLGSGTTLTYAYITRNDLVVN
jgi:hypothetical protein